MLRHLQIRNKRQLRLGSAETLVMATFSEIDLDLGCPSSHFNGLCGKRQNRDPKHMDHLTDMIPRILQPLGAPLTLVT